MGFLKNLLDNIFGKKESKVSFEESFEKPEKVKTKKKEPKLKYVFVAERPRKKIYKMIGYAFFDKKIENEENLKEKLDDKNISLVFAGKKKQSTKSKRIDKIKKAYSKIKKEVEGAKKVLLLHDYIYEAIGEKLEEEFPEVQVHNLGYTRSYDKFKDKVKISIPDLF